MAEFIVPDWPAPPRVRALATTRGGGLSDAPYASFNLATHVGDVPAAVAVNRQRLQTHLPAAPYWLNQVHGVRCLDLDAAPADNTADASLSRRDGHVCVVMTADCLPVLLCDAAGTVVAAAHAGWRGLAAGVIESTVAAMGVPGERLLAWLGPAIGPAAFEVGDEVREIFAGADAATASAFRPHGAGKWHCDLYALARRRLQRLGLTQVSGGDWCTHADRDRFFSYRRDGATGRMATLVWLAPH